MFEIGADENFGHVPFPELVGFAVARRIGREVKRFVGTYEKQVQKLPAPAGADFGAMAGRRIALRAVIRENAGDTLPEFRCGVGARRSIRLRVLTDDYTWAIGARQHSARKHNKNAQHVPITILMSCPSTMSTRMSWKSTPS